MKWSVSDASEASVVQISYHGPRRAAIPFLDSERSVAVPEFLAEQSLSRVASTNELFSLVDVLDWFYQLTIPH